MVLGITGALPTDTANFMAMITLMWVLGFTFYVTRVALEVPAGTAAAIVLMDLLLGLVIESLTNRFV